MYCKPSAPGLESLGDLYFMLYDPIPYKNTAWKEHFQSADMEPVFIHPDKYSENRTVFPLLNAALTIDATLGKRKVK